MLDVPVGVSVSEPVGFVARSDFGTSSPIFLPGTVPVAVAFAPMLAVLLVAAPPTPARIAASVLALGSVAPAPAKLVGLVPVPDGSAPLTPGALAPVLVAPVVAVPESTVSFPGVPVSDVREAGEDVFAGPVLRSFDEFIAM